MTLIFEFFFLLIAIPLMAILAGIVIIALKIFRGDKIREGREREEEEARMIQEMYQSLEKMESRIETLETLLLEKDK